jgi:hypothetical protein
MPCSIPNSDWIVSDCCLTPSEQFVSYQNYNLMRVCMVYTKTTIWWEYAWFISKLRFDESMHGLYQNYDLMRVCMVYTKTTTWWEYAWFIPKLRLDESMHGLYQNYDLMRVCMVYTKTTIWWEYAWFISKLRFDESMHGLCETNRFAIFSVTYCIVNDSRSYTPYPTPYNTNYPSHTYRCFLFSSNVIRHILTGLFCFPLMLSVTSRIVPVSLVLVILRCNS